MAHQRIPLFQPFQQGPGLPPPYLQQLAGHQLPGAAAGVYGKGGLGQGDGSGRAPPHRASSKQRHQHWNRLSRVVLHKVNDCAQCNLQWCYLPAVTAKDEAELRKVRCDV